MILCEVVYSILMMIVDILRYSHVENVYIDILHSHVPNYVNFYRYLHIIYIILVFSLHQHR